MLCRRKHVAKPEKGFPFPDYLEFHQWVTLFFFPKKKEFTEKKTLWKNSISKRVLKKMKKKRNEMTSKWTFICSLAISGSGSEWVKTKTNSVHGNTTQKILDLANGRRYDQWDEAERLLVKLLKKVNNYLVANLIWRWIGRGRRMWLGYTPKFTLHYYSMLYVLCSTTPTIHFGHSVTITMVCHVF